ncbi:DEAD/DEAH box helicase [Merismopedia glauca]|uniref:DEAD/DEAH box helicase n=1 Tax=Merismopedia glauca CCAP 1448/3 TaxID=1296344 RepID=A0A2T1C7E5_9CYAN|nr:DEAD/DEAH box helicase [Merismopedia glauca]PSB04205.1 DEAD/DEAH box helicase [Merismopedia glauca CCAP 1448/3]
MNVFSTFAEINLNTLFPFELDEFQKQAIADLNAGRSVVVCAPTGSGKTLVGEYAIYKALHGKKRVFYTTPLKALSNQKFRDFSARFGSETVGLLTGDVSINREAPVLVMTTEIFRNMLYGTHIGEVGTSLVGVETVVLDECHYMNDWQRGTVWEESIIYCPPEVQLVALSATVANSGQLTDWIDEVHGPTELVYSDYRPVPLLFHFANPKGVFPLLNDTNTRINPRLDQRQRRQKKSSESGKTKGDRPESPSLAYVVSQLQQRDMLPAIYFIFSRRGCDKAVLELDELFLVNQSEAAELKMRIDAFLARTPDIGVSAQIDAMYRGIAVHHAGVLPVWKGFVEELFTQGLIKVVFATETLAAGINMPARTTVISSLSKRTDRGHRLLTPSEFLQMAGRAGRRGMDTTGHVVTVQTRFEGAKEAAYLATTGADPLVSQFTPSYGMVLNLLQTHTLEEARELIERSFGRYISTLHLQPEEEEISHLEAELARIEATLAAVEPSLLHKYEKLQERIKVEQKILKTLDAQAEAVKAAWVTKSLPMVGLGAILNLKGKHIPVSNPLPAILVEKVAGSGHFPYLVCLGKDNRWYVVSYADTVGIHGQLNIPELEELRPPEELAPKLGQVRRGNALSGSIAVQIPYVTEEPASEVVAQSELVDGLKSQLEAHPIWQWGNPNTLLKYYKRYHVLKAEIVERQGQLQEQLAYHWQEFLNLIEILRHMGGLQYLSPTPLGEAAAAIRGDNELWLGLAISSGKLDKLDPHHLGAAVCALVTETPRPDSWTKYPPPEAVLTVLAQLRGARRNLFQCQRRYRVTLPVWLEDDLVGIIEQWALGVSWLDLCANTNLDEGDLVRMLRRTLDILSQIPHVPYISTTLQANAYRAIQLIDRFPINEQIV